MDLIWLVRYCLQQQMPEDDVAEPEEDVMQLSLTLSHLATSQGFSDRWLFHYKLSWQKETLHFQICHHLYIYIIYIYIIYIPNFLCLTILHSSVECPGLRKKQRNTGLEEFSRRTNLSFAWNVYCNRHVLRVSPCTRPTGECGGIDGIQHSPWDFGIG